MSIKNEKVSIVVPVYNSEEYVFRAANSVLNQTHENCEFIFIIDGATDASAAITLEALTSRIPNNNSCVKYMARSHVGVNGARNIGISAATGKYITFVDSDDWVTPHFIHNLFSVIADKPYVALGRYWIHSNGSTTPGFLLEGIDILKTPSVNFRMFNLEFLKSKSITFEDIPFSDFVFSAQAFMLSPVCNFTKSGDYHYYIRKDSLSKTSRMSFADFLAAISHLKKWAERNGLSDQFHYLFKYVCNKEWYNSILESMCLL